MDKADIEPLNDDAASQDDAFITVSRQAYEAMDKELQRYRALYGALPAEVCSAQQPSQEQQGIRMQESLPVTESIAEALTGHASQSDAILSILSQDDSDLKADSIEDLEASLRALSSNEVIRHYGFKRMKMNHR